MILFIAAIAVGLVLGIVAAVKNEDIIAGVFIGVISWLAIFGFGSGITNVVMGGNTSYVKDATFDLQAINAGTNTDGSFFIGSGYIDEEAVYRFYQRNGDGSFSMETVDAEDAKIFERQGSPKIVRFEAEPTHPTWSVITGGTGYRYEIYVPPGSVTSDVKLNLPS